MQTVFNWAVRHGLLTQSSLIGYEKPRARVRTRVIEPAEFQSLLRHTDAVFRRVLIALRLTGCRPGEIRNLIWPWVDLSNGLWIFPDHKTITRQQNPMPRIIPLPAPIHKMCKSLRDSTPNESGHVFLNSRGTPYTKDAFCTKMRRLRKRAGIVVKAGEELVLYSARHTFATQAAGKVTDIELAELLGQTDTRTTSQDYSQTLARMRKRGERGSNCWRGVGFSPV